MFCTFMENGEYCIREIGKAPVDRYEDFRLFSSDLKVRLQNEAETAQLRKAIPTEETNKSAPENVRITERRKRARRKIERNPHTYS